MKNAPHKRYARQSIIQIIKDTASYGHAIGYDLINEGILARKRYGRMLRELTNLFAESHVYYLDISFKETLKRHQSKPNSHEFGQEQIREWYLEKDTLGLAGETLCTDAESEDEIFNAILIDLQKK